MLEKIDKHLPRFETYIKAFPHSTRISDAALNLYIKIAGFQLDSILFLQRNPLSKASSKAFLYKLMLRQLTRNRKPNTGCLGII